MANIIKKIVDARNLRLWKNQRKKVYKKSSAFICNNKRFNNISNGKTCFIFGNGPSIKNLDFELFKDVDVITVNQITRNDNFYKLHPKYHFWADPMFFYETENHEIGITDEFFEKMLQIYRGNEAVEVFAVSNPSNAVCKKISESHSINFYCAFGRLENYLDLPFDLSTTCPGFYNVMQYAIYSAMSMGYKKIYLLGCEQSNLIMILETLIHEQNKYHYGYNINEFEEKRMISQYNKSSVTVWIEQHYKMFKDFDYLKKIADRNQIKIFNCTKESLLKCFDYIPIDVALQNVKD